MAANENDSMASLITSLSKSFGQVPSVAVPAVLECVLASTGLSPSTLFVSLLDTFQILIQVSMINQITGWYKACIWCMSVLPFLVAVKMECK